MSNREIKFRVYDENKKQMVFNPTINDGLFYDGWTAIEDGANIKGVLMQYTGLKDKEGKEIFEGDILMIEQINGEKYVAPVEYKNVSFCVKVTREHYVIIFPENDWEEGKKYYEVIGNIYETPELIK